MTELLLKLFVKSSADSNDPAVRKKYGSVASGVGIAVNVLLSALKLVIGVITASVAVMADALNNLSDAGASGISMLSFKLSSKPADRDHPFGHARIEYISSMIVSFLILLVGFETLIDSVKRILGFSESESPNFSTVAVIILGISILCKLWLALFYRKVGKKIGSSVIMAAATDSLTDCISTTAVLASSIVVKITDIEIIDSIVGLAVSFLIIIAGARILNETKNSLLGEAPVEDMVAQIKEIVAEEKEVLGIHDLLVHNYGPGKFIASFHAEVDGAHDIFHLHDAIDNLEKLLGERLNIQCTIHLDPIVTDDERIIHLKELATDAVKKVCSDAGLHDFRAVIGATHTNLIFDVELPFEVKESTSEIAKRIEEEVQLTRPDCYCVITVDRC